MFYTHFKKRNLMAIISKNYIDKTLYYMFYFDIMAIKNIFGKIV